MLVVTLVRKTSLAQNGSQVGTAAASPQTQHQLACPSHAPSLPQDPEILEVRHLRQGLPTDPEMANHLFSGREPRPP